MSKAQGCFKEGDKLSYIWREDLTSPAAAAKLVSNRKSNLPPSKEGGQGDCDRANREDVQQRKVPSVRRQPLIYPLWLRLDRVG